MSIDFVDGSNVFDPETLTSQEPSASLCRAFNIEDGPVEIPSTIAAKHVPSGRGHHSR